jgi:hypothetical protein
MAKIWHQHNKSWGEEEPVFCSYLIFKNNQQGSSSLIFSESKNHRFQFTLNDQENANGWKSWHRILHGWKWTT